MSLDLENKVSWAELSEDCVPDGFNAWSSSIVHEETKRHAHGWQLVYRNRREKRRATKAFHDELRKVRPYSMDVTGELRSSGGLFWEEFGEVNTIGEFLKLVENARTLYQWANLIVAYGVPQSQDESTVHVRNGVYSAIQC
jgi:hypothetical protein